MANITARSSTSPAAANESGPLRCGCVLQRPGGAGTDWTVDSCMRRLIAADVADVAWAPCPDEECPHHRLEPAMLRVGMGSSIMIYASMLDDARRERRAAGATAASESDETTIGIAEVRMLLDEAGVRNAQRKRLTERGLRLLVRRAARSPDGARNVIASTLLAARVHPQRHRYRAAPIHELAVRIGRANASTEAAVSAALNELDRLERS